MTNKLLSEETTKTRAEVLETLSDLDEGERALVMQMASQVADFSFSLMTQVRRICEVTGITRHSERRWEQLCVRATQAASVVVAGGIKYADKAETKEMS